MKKIFISSAITPPSTPPAYEADYNKLQRTMCNIVENISTEEDEYGNDIDVGSCSGWDCGKCILGETNLEMFKDWCKPNTITLACDGCVWVASAYCEHCTRGKSVKDFYQTEIPQSPPDNNTT